MQADFYETGRKSRNEFKLKKRNQFELNYLKKWNTTIRLVFISFHKLVVACRQQHLVHVKILQFHYSELSSALISVNGFARLFVFYFFLSIRSDPFKANGVAEMKRFHFISSRLK